MSDDSNARQRKFLKKAQLAERYSTTTRSVERMVADGRLPKPYRFGARSPRWDERELEEHERRALAVTATA